MPRFRHPEKRPPTASGLLLRAGLLALVLLIWFFASGCARVRRYLPFLPPKGPAAAARAEAGRKSAGPKSLRRGAPSARRPRAPARSKGGEGSPAPSAPLPPKAAPRKAKPAPAVRKKSPAAPPRAAPTPRRAPLPPRRALSPAHRRAQIARYRKTLQAFLKKDTLPLVDLEVFLDREADLPRLIRTMDEEGVALAAVTAPEWRTVKKAVRRHPDRLVPLTAEGVGAVWAIPGSRFAEEARRQLEEGAFGLGPVTLLAFPEPGAAEPPKKGAAKKKKRFSPPLQGGVFEQLLRLAGEKRVAVWIGLEPEDERVGQLERVLRAHPRARVVWTQAGRLPRPEMYPAYGSGLLRAMTVRHPNLMLTLAMGARAREYFPTRIHEYLLLDPDGTLSPEWRAMVESRIRHFAAASSLGPPHGNRYPARIRRFRKAILQTLTTAAAERLAYRNAWRLLFGEAWKN